MRFDVSQQFKRIDEWRSHHVSNQVYLFVVASVVGLIVGCCAAFLKWIIGAVGRILTINFVADTYNLPLLLLPVVGILLTGVFQRYVLNRNLEHGVDQVMHDFATHRLHMPGYLTWAWMAAGTMTLGFGGSAGSEGPIACTGAAVGSNVGRLLGFEKRVLYVIVGCGAGAGIAGIFKAPLGGALFALEVLKLEFTTVSMIALLLACIVSAMTAYALSGFTVDMSFLQMEQLPANTVVYILALGVFCGLYSVYYSAVMKRMAKVYDGIRNPWVRNLVSGGLLSLIVFCFPAMYGEGYDIIGDILNGRFSAIVGYGSLFRDLSDPWTLFKVVGIIALLKCFAASAANSGGGVAGDFAPTLFAGCFVGFFFGMMCNKFFGVDLPVEAMAYMGMAGVMAGAIRAPLMALFLTAEMTNGFILFLPLLAVSGISYGIVRLICGPDYYSTPRNIRLPW